MSDGRGRLGASIQISGSPTLPETLTQSSGSVQSAKSESTKVPVAASQSSSAHPPPAMAAAPSTTGARRETFDGGTIIIPELSGFFFKKGADKTNALLNTIKPGCFNEGAFRAAINELLDNQEELNSFRRRGPKEKTFIDFLLTQAGVKIP
jgi:hypothetical protein